MRLAIVGSRNFTNYEVFKETLEDYLTTRKLRPTLIVSGGATGVDSMAERWAKESSLQTLIFPVTPKDWDEHGKAAGPLRNSKIVKEADKVIVFWDRFSRGTKDTINKAKKERKLLTIFSTKSIEEAKNAPKPIPVSIARTNPNIRPKPNAR